MYVSFMCVFCVWGSKCLSVLVCVCFVFACIEGPTVCQFCGCVLCLCALMDKSVNFVCVCFVLGPNACQFRVCFVLARIEGPDVCQCRVCVCCVCVH